MRVRFMTVAALAVAVSLALGGCASVKNTLDAKLAPKPKLVTQEATVAVPGASIVGTIPAQFPDSLALWPGSKVIKTKVTKTPNGTSYALSMLTRDPFSDVLAGIGKGFTDSGWKVTAADVSAGKQKVTILTVAGSSGEGIVTVSQVATGPVTIDYVVTPHK